jgi:hypothetical protein
MRESKVSDHDIAPGMPPAIIRADKPSANACCAPPPMTDGGEWAHGDGAGDRP